MRQTMDRMQRIAILALLLASLGCSDPESARTTPADAATGAGSAEPDLAVTADGRAVLSWLAPAGAGVELRYAIGDADGWSAPRTIAAGDDWFVNWADFPSVVPLSGDLWAAHWLRKSGASPYAYDVVMSISADAGATWSAPFSPHDDGTQTEHGFVSLFPHGDDVGALWLDGRNTLDDDPEAAAMTLRAATFDATGVRVTDQLVDARVCDCCQTDVAIAASGPVAVYRDRTIGEIRDIAVTRNVDGRWSASVPVANDGWEIAGCPVNGPAVAARGEQVVVAWFTAADNVPRVRLSFSTDGGKSFGPAIDVDSRQPLGRVGLVMLPDGDALISWLAEGSNSGSADILAARYAADGRQGAVRRIAITGAGRLAGFPRVVVAGTDVVFAWTDTDGETTIVRSTREPVSVF